MHKYECPECENVFYSEKKTRKYCSIKCSAKNQPPKIANSGSFKKGQVSWNTSSGGAVSGKIVDKVCIECGGVFQQLNERKGICPPCIKVRRQRFRPQTFIKCQQCDKEFHPSHLSKKFCSRDCSTKAKTIGIGSIRKPTREARNANRLLKYYVDKGKINRPSSCEECGCSEKKIEGAHYDYAAPLDVRWLCKSCHTKWDAEKPKGGTIKIELTKRIKNPYPKERKMNSLDKRAVSGAQFTPEATT